jgi:anti-sigma factor RsiW
MAECRDLESLFAAYVDGEAGPADCAALDIHFRTCPVCRDRVAGERVVRDTVVAQRERLRACASADLRRRCEERCRPAAAPPWGASSSPRAGVFSRKPWLPLSMVATLALAVAGVFLWGLGGSVAALGVQLAADHVKCFEFASPPTVMPDARAIGRDWAQARGWAITVPESAANEQLELLEIRRCISLEGRTAHIMYKWRGQPLSVYVLNSKHPRVGSAPQLVERLGQEELIWSKGGRTYAIVTRGHPPDIEQVARYVQRSAE